MTKPPHRSGSLTFRDESGRPRAPHPGERVWHRRRIAWTPRGRAV